MKSEKDAYMRSLKMIASLRIYIESVRLDKYYSGQIILDVFLENTKIFIVAKKNSRIKGSKRWRNIIRRFMNDPLRKIKKTSKEATSKKNSPQTRDRQSI